MACPSTSHSLSSRCSGPPSSARVVRRSRGVRVTAAAKEGGGGFMDFFSQAPQVRVRRSMELQKQQLAELAVLNERLGGRQPWEARKKLDYFQKCKASWEAVYQDVLSSDAIATLETIEEAQRKVNQALSEEFREGNSVTDLRVQLQELKGELEMARKKLQTTQELVTVNEAQVMQLQEEAEKLRTLSTVEIPEPVSSLSAATTLDVRSTRLTKEAATAKTAPRASPVKKPTGKQANQNMLNSTLDIEEGLRDYWYPVEFSSSLKDKDTLIPLELFNDTFVLFRNEDGAPACVVDECAHRACPLSLGSVVDGQIQCAYHGWQFNKEGECTKMPSTAFCKGIKVKALEVQEKDGLIWMWAGNSKPFRDIPDIGIAPEGHIIHSELVLEVPVEHGLLVENLLDLAHAPFTHTSTFARGWPVPDAVKFRMMSMLGGEWDPYPIDMTFEPPCMTVSVIGLQQPGQVERGARAADCEKHLRQMHVCLPSKPGHTRLLYRMSLDFMPILKKLPFMNLVWKEMANQVLGEDLVLVQGQQKRMELGGNTWANPVSYDKLAVRYRRWRNSLDCEDDEEKEEAEAALSDKMSAGELFSIVQEEQTAR